MSIINRLFDSITTALFILWIFFNLFERYYWSAFCIAAMLCCFAILLLLRLLVFYKITSHRVKQ